MHGTNMKFDMQYFCCLHFIVNLLEGSVS